MRWTTWIALVPAALGIGAAGRTGMIFRQDMKRRAAELDAGSRLARTAAGPVEYAREGTGPTVLVIHGAGGGYDQGLLIAGEMFGAAFDVIAPSRFGYLKTPIPKQASPAAQADAHAALLDVLGVETAIVVGVSAGAPSAIEIALRHPSRVKALILAVPLAYAPGQAVGVDTSVQSRAVLGLVSGGADFAFWLAIRLARAAVVRFLGVPPDVEANAPGEERARITAIMRSILPLSRRAAGLRNDGEIKIAPWPLENIAAPTLVIAAADDLFKTLPAARFTAEHIPGAELKVLETGGHLMVARGDEVRGAIAEFLRRRSDPSVGPAA